MKKTKAGKALPLIGIVICLLIQTGCSVVVTDRGLHDLNEKILQKEQKEEAVEGNPELSAVKIPETQISDEVREALDSGKRILDKSGETAALIRRTEGVTGFENARDGKMLYLNYGNTAAEYFAAEEIDLSEYFETYTGKEKLSQFASFKTYSRKVASVDCLSFHEAGIQKRQEMSLPKQLEKNKTEGEWEMYTYLKEGEKYAEYFCAIPFKNFGNEGLLSVHMRFRLSRSEADNSRDPIFMKAVEAVVPIITE